MSVFAGFAPSEQRELAEGIVDTRRSGLWSGQGVVVWPAKSPRLGNTVRGKPGRGGDGTNFISSLESAADAWIAGDAVSEAVSRVNRQKKRANAWE